MFERSIPYYDEFYGHLNYRGAVQTLCGLIDERQPNARSLLDVACGTGRHLEHLSQRYETEGLDILPGLLEMASKRCPGVPLHQGDMMSFTLGRRFDVVTCLFCSIGYSRTLDNAERAILNMAAHLRPGGLLIVEPWVTPEMCWTHRVTSEVLDKPDLKIVRMHTHEKDGQTSVFDIHYLIGTPDRVEHFVEREVLGLFTQAEYLEAFKKAGLQAELLDLDLFPGHRYGVLIGTRMGD